jgi:predicted dehydrogenase/nucleoside-diphosphate-sugar epimerase
MAKKEHAAALTRPVTVGLIGTGKMGLHHLKAIAHVNGARVVGVADPAASAESLADVLPAGARVFKDAGEMLAAARPDVVHIVTPPRSHAALGELVLRAGSHVYIEKPFTPTRREAATLLSIAAERGLKVCAGHQCLFERPSLLALERLESIGRLVHVESVFSFRKVRRTITAVEQAVDILPHAVYPVVAQLRASSHVPDAAFELKGLDVRASGDVYALVRLDDATGIIIVTLSGRPIEQYQHLIGTNGWLRADYVTGALTTLTGPGTGPGALFTPYRRAWQTTTGATKGFSSLIFGGHGSYPGLSTLITRFYQSIADNGPSPLSPQSILDTVDVCERIGTALAEAERETEARAQVDLASQAAALSAPAAENGTVLVTGGSGFLGRPVLEELRHAGFAVRSLGRRLPPWSARVAGIEYVAGDLAEPLDPAIMNGVTAVVHCAAETAGGKDEHTRNSIAATRSVIEAAAAAGVRDLIHVSSVAVVKPGREVGGPIDEETPVDVGNLARGPYVWGKAESETLARTLGAERGLRVKIVRLGPLVDYADFQPPGRLGRELGPLFVAIGGKRSALSVCDVRTAARVFRSYVQDPSSAPPVLNLVEAPPPTRRDLVARLRQRRPDLRVFWFPGWLLRVLNGPLKLAQRLALGSSIDVAAAFASERYRTDLAAATIEHAGPTRIAARPPAVTEPTVPATAG